MTDPGGNLPHEGKLDEAEKNLYSRDPKTRRESRFALPTHPYEVAEDWPRNEEEFMRRKAHFNFLNLTGRSPLVKGFLIFSVLFFLAAAVFAFLTFYRGSNVVSSENVSIGIAGPTSVPAGESLSLDVIISNNNAAPLTALDLRVIYPESTRDPKDFSKELPRERHLLGEIEPGGEQRKKISAVLFGEEGTKRQINFSLEYRVKGSNAIFYKERSYEVVISSSPISLLIEAPKETSAGQEFEMTVNVSSNSTTVIENLLMKVEYGFGFKFSRSVPEPFSGSDTWRVGDLKPGEKRSVKIKGKLEGQDGEERTFRFLVGVGSQRNERIISTELLSQSSTLQIRKPFLGLNLTLDGESGKEVAAGAAAVVSGEVFWINNLPNRVNDVEITVHLSGSALDRFSVSTARGFFRSVDNTIIWSKSDTPELAVLAPGDSGTFNFRLASLPVSSLLSAGLSNQEIGIEVSAKAKRTSESRVPEEIISSVSRRIKISSTLGLNARVLRSIGPFRNVGPIPPKADQETTYTVTWSVTNSLNAAAAAEVRASLPQYINWLSMTSPAAEKITFNSDMREVVWDVGELKPGTGFGTAPREVSFQILLLASVSQVNSQPVLIGQSVLTGQDKFTGVKLESQWKALNTNFDTDPAFRFGDGTVRP